MFRSHTGNNHTKLHMVQCAAVMIVLTDKPFLYDIYLLIMT